ncbi:hypothetical protein HRbin08_02030 [bacterium HR08]|nr:hypothetical protein HRbin08_02030 [bacterium HR08]
MIEAHQHPADRMLLLAVNLPDEDGVQEPTEPTRAEREFPHVGEEQPDRRIERDRQHRSDRHGEVLREGEGFEEPSLLRFQSEDRHERDRDHQEREEARSPHFLHRPNDHIAEILRTPRSLPLFEPLVRLLDDDDRRIHHRANGDGDPAERHDVGRNPHRIHRDEREEHRGGDGDDGDQRARDVPEENEDHGAHDHQLLDERPLQRRDGAQDQVRPIVGRDDLHPFGEGALDLGQARLHALDDLQRVLPIPHDHDAADGLPLSIQLGDAATNVRSQSDRAQMFHQDGRPRLRIDPHDDVLDVLEGSDVTATAHHVLPPGELDEPPPHVVVPPPNRAHDGLQRDAIGEQGIGVEIHLILPDEAANGSDFGHPWHRLQRVAQMPILKRAELGQTPFPRRIHQSILKDPSDGGHVLGQLHLHAFGQLRQDAAQILERSRARPVNVRPILEDHVHVGIAEIREAANVFHPRQSEQGADDRIRHLILDDVRAAIPPGVDDHLRVREIGDGVQRDVAHGMKPDEQGHADEEEDEESVVRAEFDEPFDHTRPSALTAGVPNVPAAASTAPRARGRARHG